MAYMLGDRPDFGIRAINDTMQDSIATKIRRLDATVGRPQTPMQHASRHIDLARQSGRTYELIRALPDSGRAIIVVHSQRSAGFIRSKVAELRGPLYPVHALVFFTSKDMAQNRAAGLTAPVFVDNEVLDLLCYNYVTAVNRGMV